MGSEAKTWNAWRWAHREEVTGVKSWKEVIIMERIVVKGSNLDN